MGDCDVPLQIAKGAVSPCDGYVMSSNTELKIRTDLVYKTSLIDNLQKQNAIQDDMLKISDKEIKQYQSIQPMNGWEKGLWFSLGVFASGAAVWGASKLIR